MYKNQLDDGFLALTNTDFSKFGDLFQLVLGLSQPGAKGDGQGVVVLDPLLLGLHHCGLAL